MPPIEKNDDASNTSQYIQLMKGKPKLVTRHPTDFTAQATPDKLGEVYNRPGAQAYQVSRDVTRIRAKDEIERDRWMDQVRQQIIAHHIYRFEESGQEALINDQILLTLGEDDPEKLEAIMREYHLVLVGHMDKAYVLRLTNETGSNPVKAASEIAQREEVDSCRPQVLIPIQLNNAVLAGMPVLFGQQWYLASEGDIEGDIVPTAAINAPGAWLHTFGSPQTVIAVIDDGFDLRHPKFKKVQKLHPDKRDFVDGDFTPSAEGANEHGTCVASIATATREGGGMMGVAPDCTFLPIRFAFGGAIDTFKLLEVFNHVSKSADVVNCSFSTPPFAEDFLEESFRNAITQLTITGGRRGKGLVIVFSAGNYDAPTLLSGAENRNGVRFVRRQDFGPPAPAMIEAEKEIFSFFPRIPGVIVVGAITSLKRKAGYSNWGPQLTICAPSSNFHDMANPLLEGLSEEIRERFRADYRGQRLIAAVNRIGIGRPFNPIAVDDPATLGTLEPDYTELFGGTSGAAPIVTGVVALMLSVNPELTAEQVVQILKETADTDLEPELDLENDPNIQGLSGAFVDGQSLFFGAGKIDAARAVERARELADANPPV